MVFEGARYPVGPNLFKQRRRIDTRDVVFDLPHNVTKHGVHSNKLNIVVGTLVLSSLLAPQSKSTSSSAASPSSANKS